MGRGLQLISGFVLLVAASLLTFFGLFFVTYRHEGGERTSY
jgi:hypothetical protein